MLPNTSDSSSKLLPFLKRHAPFSVIERGIAFAKAGVVGECNKTANKITGVIRDSDGITHATSLLIISAQEIEPTCSCCSVQDMREQWCTHAVALLWQASGLEFLETQSGFAATEAMYRINVSSPQEIARVMTEILRPESAPPPVPHTIPAVAIELDVSTDRLGVRVLFDGEVQAPAVFEQFRRISGRALDNVLIDTLEDKGTWDENESVWFINSSQSIEHVLGLLREYPDLKVIGEKKRLTFATELLDAKLSVQWHDDSAELVMYWCLPNGEQQIKDGELIGTGPYWVVINDTLYKISPAAARVSSIFPHSSTITLSKGQTGPILEPLVSHLASPKYLEVLNPELQPDTAVKTPSAAFELARREDLEPGIQDDEFTLYGNLEFIYPTPPKGSNLVYLPDREKEQDSTDLLKSLGFTYQPTRRRYEISGDAALDLVHEGAQLFPKDWKVTGVNEIRTQLKFAELSIKVSLSSPTDAKALDANFERIDWFDCHVSLVQNNANVPISSLFKNQRGTRDRWVKLDSGAYAKVPGGGISHLRTTLGMLDPNIRLSNTIKAKLSAAQAISVSRMDDELVHVTSDKRIKALSTKLDQFKKIEAINPSKTFKGKLRNYQKEGVGWLKFLHDFSLGGILADEMGLGKTVQALALLHHLQELQESAKDKPLPTLVVCPTSVMMNWMYEAARFTPKLKTLLLHGTERKKTYASIPNHDLVITSYALLRIDRIELEKYRFGYLILDEAQNIKNYQAATTKAAKALRAEHRLALTGTPTENRPMELWSIMDFLMPGYLGSGEYFRTHIEKPILDGGPGVKIANFLNTKTRPFLLRRLKAEVEKELPPKVESNLYVPMAPSQQGLYAEILEEVRPKVFEAVEKKGMRGASVSILAALLRLRQVCNHPNSIEALKDLDGFESGKFNALKELIEEALDSGRKILLFSQFRGMLDIIRTHLNQEKINHLYLDGATRNRQELIDQFNTDPEVRLFLISLKAGGTGLNLASADAVIIYDPWWNPAVESQAIDRAHRIGQSKTVHVYRLITENSIEQKIMKLKEKKSAIVDALINENGVSSLKLSRDDLESLFSPMPTQGS